MCPSEFPSFPVPAAGGMRDEEENVGGEPGLCTSLHSRNDVPQAYHVEVRYAKTIVQLHHLQRVRIHRRALCLNVSQLRL